MNLIFPPDKITINNIFSSGCLSLNMTCFFFGFRQLLQRYLFGVSVLKYEIFIDANSHFSESKLAFVALLQIRLVKK